MLKPVYTSILWILAVLQCPIGSNGEETTLCYIRKDDTNTVLCIAPSYVMCCNQQQLIAVDRIQVYGNNSCKRASHCGTGRGCCVSQNNLDVREKYLESLNQTFRSTNCFNNVSDATVDLLPKKGRLVSVVVSYSCTGGTTAASDIIPTISQQTTVPDSNTNVAAAVVVPVVIVLVIAGVLAAAFLIRRRRLENKGSVQSIVEPITSNGFSQKSTPDYRQDADLPPSYDEGVNSEYAEIAGNRNSNLFGESNEYNTISLQHFPVTNDQIPAGRQATSEDYDHIGIQSTALSKGTDTYAHIDHSTAKRLNVSNVGVDTDTSMYARAAHTVQQRHRTNTVDVGGDAYAHVDHSGKQRQTENTRFNGGDTYAHVNHGALQEHGGNGNSNTYDSTSTSGVHREGGQYASEESQYDHTDHNALNGSLGQYQDGGDYSHVGNLSTSRQRGDDRTASNVNQNQSPVSGTKEQNDQKNDPLVI